MPAELRPLIYKAYLGHQDLCDTFDYHRLQGYETATAVQCAKRKTYSWLFVDPIMYNEGLPLVMRTHPILFTDPHDTQQESRKHVPYWNKIRSVRLDFGPCSIDDVRIGLHNLAALDMLHQVKLTISTPKDNNCILPRPCRYCRYRSQVLYGTVRPDQGQKLSLTTWS